MSNQTNNEQLLYETIKSLLAGQEWTANGHDFGEWTETVEALAGTPPDERLQVFQSLDTFHRGELSRLLSTYRPEAAVPAVVTTPPPECPDLPPHVQPDPYLAEKGSPWLDRYIEFSKKWSPRSYEGYHEACGLWLLSTIAARRVACDLGDNYYTNLYMMMVGKSSKYAKSGATAIAIAFLHHLGLNWLCAPRKTTPQGFTYYLSGQPPKGYASMEPKEQKVARLKFGFAAQRGGFYEEFGNGIVSMTRNEGYMSDFRSLLREWDDCPLEYETATKTYGLEKVERPYLALLASLTPADLGKVARRGAQIWQDGFLPRFGFVTPPISATSRARYPREKRTMPPALTEPLRKWHQRLGLPTVEVGEGKKGGSAPPASPTLRLVTPPPLNFQPVDDEVIDAMYEYNFALLDIAETVHDDLESPYNRLHERAMRVALLLASVEGDESVGLKHWARAQMVAEGWRVSLHRLYKQITDQVGYSPELDLEERILELLKQHKSLTPGEMRAYIKNRSTDQIGRQADALVEAGLLQVTTKPWGQRIIKRYSLPPSEPPSPAP